MDNIKKEIFNLIDEIRDLHKKKDKFLLKILHCKSSEERSKCFSKLRKLDSDILTLRHLLENIIKNLAIGTYE